MFNRRKPGNHIEKKHTSQRHDVYRQASFGSAAP